MKSKPARDRCYVIQTPRGPLRIRASKPPNEKTVKALGELFEAARKRLSGLKSI